MFKALIEIKHSLKTSIKMSTKEIAFQTWNYTETMEASVGLVFALMPLHMFLTCEMKMALPSQR